jgi:hypothetical protein
MTGYQPIVIPFNYPGIHLVEAVGFEPTDPFGPLVFKTSSLSRTLTHFRKLWYPCPDSNRDT